MIPASLEIFCLSVSLSKMWPVPVINEIIFLVPESFAAIDPTTTVL